MRALDRSLAQVLQRCFACLQAETKLATRRRRLDAQAIEAAEANARRAYFLALLGHHLQYDTRGQAALTPFAGDSAEFERVEGAVLGAFDADVAFEGVPAAVAASVEVVYVARVGNEPLAQQFAATRAGLEAAHGPEAAKTKGLFCAVDVREIERGVVAGVGAAGAVNAVTRALFEQWPPQPTTAGPGYLQDVLSQSRAMELPVVFSKSANLCSSRRKLLQAAAKGGTAAEGQQETDEADGEYLLLCRVITGRSLSVGVRRAPPEGFESAHGSGDQEESATDREFYVSRSNQILPEYLIRLQFMGDDEEEDESGTGGVEQSESASVLQKALRSATGPADAIREVLQSHLNDAAEVMNLAKKASELAPKAAAQAALAAAGTRKAVLKAQMEAAEEKLCIEEAKTAELARRLKFELPPEPAPKPASRAAASKKGKQRSRGPRPDFTLK